METARKSRRVGLRALGGVGVVALFLTVFSLTATAGGGTQQISAKALTDHECNSTEWHFVINQIQNEASAPASIQVSWANGQNATVPRDKFTGGVAHYVTTANLGSTVTSATATIYAGWSGQFNVSHGPCGEGPPNGTTPTGGNTPAAVGGAVVGGPGGAGSPAQAVGGTPQFTG